MGPQRQEPGPWGPGASAQSGVGGAVPPWLPARRVAFAGPPAPCAVGTLGETAKPQLEGKVLVEEHRFVKEKKKINLKNSQQAASRRGSGAEPGVEL